MDSNSPGQATTRSALFARLKAESPLPIRLEEAPLPGGFVLAPDEFLIGTAKDWGLGGLKLALTTQRLICPSDPAGKVGVSISLADILEVTYRKSFVGYSMLAVATSNGDRYQFPAHANGKKLRDAILSMVRFATRDPGAASLDAARPTADKYDQLRKIAELKAAGVLSDAEFEQEKARLLKLP
jgi:hypothetical protein